MGAWHLESATCLHPQEGHTGSEAGPAGAPEDTGTAADGKGEVCVSGWEADGREPAVR